jgi:hypothetical protein
VYAGGDTGLCFDMSMPSFSITALAKGSVVSPGAHAGRTDEDAASREMAQDRRCHRRAHGVAIAGEEDRARQIARKRQGINPSSEARRAA